MKEGNRAEQRRGADLVPEGGRQGNDNAEAALGDIFMKAGA